MPSVQEIRALQRARKKARRRRMYLLGTVLLVAIIAVAVVVYAYIQPGGTNPGLHAVVYAKLNTSQGVIEIELYQNATPKTVTNFVLRILQQPRLAQNCEEFRNPDGEFEL